MTAPLWLSDEKVSAFLNKVVDRIDQAEAKGTALGPIKIDERSYPALFKALFELDRERYWGYLEEMASWGWFRLKMDKATPGQADYERKPRIVDVDAAKLRQTTERHSRLKSPFEAWREALENHLDAPADVKEKVSRYRIEIPGRTADEIAIQLNRMKLYHPAKEPWLMREVSSQLFWGQSKILDGRQALICALLGLEECPFPEMPVQLQVYLPAYGFKEVLFIENLSSFEQATIDITGKYEGKALVFASGFKGAAKRLRTPGGASVYFSAAGNMNRDEMRKFLGWLREEWEFDKTISCLFWGDLDYSGMRILATLRNSFGASTDAWEPGYAPMLQALRDGKGHAPIAAGKENQAPLDSANCKYADEVLIPELKKTGMFVDQEGF